MYEENYSVRNEEGLNIFFKKTYGIMALALMISAITGAIVKNYFLSSISNLFYAHPLALIAFIVVEFILIAMIGHSSKSPVVSGTLLGIFSIVQGILLGIILSVYTPASIFGAFVSAASLFAGMALWGYFTKKSLASWGTILFGSVIALFIASIVNLFILNSVFSLIISVITIIVFSLYTAYDNQMLKEMYYESNDGFDSLNGLAIFGALNLYLDFINIFLSILRIIGKNN